MSGTTAHSTAGTSLTGTPRASGGAAPVHRLLERLDHVTGGNGKWTARCPVHDDRSNSLSIGIGDGGKVLLNCFTGCDFAAIVAAAGLEPSDCFPETAKNKSSPPFNRKPLEHSNAPEGASEPPCTLAAYADMKQLPVERLRSFGLSDRKYLGAPAIRFSYRDQAGRETAVRFRVRLHKSPDGDERFRWQSGAKLTLYGRERLRHARERGYVALVEGESDCHTLWCAGEPAVGIPGANNWNDARDAPEIDGIETIYVTVEPDKGGEAVRKWLAASSIRDRVKLVDLSPYGVKDPSELWLLEPDQFLTRWRAALAAATPWTAQADAARRNEAETAAADAAELLTAPDLVERIAAAIRDGGYAGDPTPAVLAYFGATSRLLERPMNLAFVAQSSAGKSRAAEAGLDLIPPEAVYVVKAGSSRALIYNDESFEHRIVFFHEADSIPEDGPAASAVRSLASDNCMEYETVERDEQTGKFNTRKIHKPGPTGLLTTSTKPPREQLGTRVLEVAIPDDAVQTRKIMQAHAQRAMFGSSRAVDRAPFLALQRWLELAGERRVAVPFADVLAASVPARAVRMRRDFPQLLTCVQTSALLFQAQRTRADDGAIVAEIADYQTAYDLLCAVFATVAAEGVTPAIRETVAKILEGEEISEAELARRLKLSKSTVSWRVRKSRAGGWIVNNETKRGQPARLALGAPLPEDEPALPDPDSVRAAFERSNDSGTEGGTLLFSDSHRDAREPGETETIELVFGPEAA